MLKNSKLYKFKKKAFGVSLKKTCLNNKAIASKRGRTLFYRYYEIIQFGFNILSNRYKFNTLSDFKTNTLIKKHIKVFCLTHKDVTCV